MRPARRPGLLTLIPGLDDGAVTLHDVIRDYLRQRLGTVRLAQLHQILLDVVGEGLPRAPAARASGGKVTAWWELPETTRYVQEHPALRRTLTGHARWVTVVAVSPDGTRQVEAVAIAPDGAWLAIASKDGSVRIWDPATRSINAVMRVDCPLGHCAWSPSGQSFAAAGNIGVYHFIYKP